MEFSLYLTWRIPNGIKSVFYKGVLAQAGCSIQKSHKNSPYNIVKTQAKLRIGFGKILN